MENLLNAITFFLVMATPVVLAWGIFKTIVSR